MVLTAKQNIRSAYVNFTFSNRNIKLLDKNKDRREGCPSQGTPNPISAIIPEQGKGARFCKSRNAL